MEIKSDSIVCDGGKAPVESGKRVGAYAGLKSQAAKRALRKICDGDDVGELAKFLAQRKGREPEPGAHGKMALDAAIGSDAASIFAWLAGADSGRLGARLDEPLVDAVYPAHRCCETRGGTIPEAALRCLELCARADPLCWTREGPSLRTPLQLAATRVDIQAFEILCCAAASCVERGLANRAEFDKRVGQALWACMESGRQPASVLEKLGAMEACGFDWKAARTPAGNSALGAAMGAGQSRYCQGPLAVALVKAGASPMLPFSKDPSWCEEAGEYDVPMPCLERILSPEDLMWVGQPELARSLVNAVADVDFVEAFDSAFKGYRAGLVEEYLNHGAGGEAAVGRMVWAHRQALSQARDLDRELSGSPGSLAAARKRSL